MSLAEEEDYASEVEPSVENELSDYHDWDAGPSTEDIFSSEEGLVGSEGPDDEAGEGEAGEDCVQEDGQEQEEIAVLHEVSEEEEDDFVSEDLYDDLFDGDFLPYEASYVIPYIHLLLCESTKRLRTNKRLSFVGRRVRRRCF